MPRWMRLSETRDDDLFHFVPSLRCGKKEKKEAPNNPRSI